jgi:hypothetical protein
MLAMEQLALMLEQAGLGRRGETIFVHFMPAEVGSGIVLLDSLSGREIDYAGLPELRRFEFQAIIRDPKPLSARLKAQSVIDAITMLPAWREIPAINRDIPAARVLYIRPRHAPIIYPRADAGDGYEASVNFDAAGAE